MTLQGWLQILVFFGVVVALTKPIGVYLFWVFERERPSGRIERGVLRLCGVREPREQTWLEYTVAMLVFSALGLVVTYFIQRTQAHLPWNPQHLPNIDEPLAFNTASSFTTNTNWQSYVPEAKMSYLTQMAGLAWHNFTSAAVGIGVALAVARGLTRVRAQTVGNFWVDLIRGVIYVLLPVSIVVALALVSRGVIQ